MTYIKDYDFFADRGPDDDFWEQRRIDTSSKTPTSPYVYVVMGDEGYEGYQLLGVYSTREKAMFVEQTLSAGYRSAVVMKVKLDAAAKNSHDENEELA